jgi:hypothetical protein
MPVIPTLHTGTSKYVRILRYFSNREGVREEERFGNIAISKLSVVSVRDQLTVRDSGCWPQTLGKGKRNTSKNSRTEHVISLLQEAVDMLWYTICKHLL